MEQDEGRSQATRLSDVQHVTLMLHRSHIIGSSKSFDLHSSVPPHWTYLTQSNHIDAVIHVLGYLRYHSYPCDTDDCKSSLTPHQATDPNLAALEIKFYYGALAYPYHRIRN